MLSEHNHTSSASATNDFLQVNDSEPDSYATDDSLENDLPREEVEATFLQSTFRQKRLVPCCYLCDHVIRGELVEIVYMNAIEQLKTNDLPVSIKTLSRMCMCRQPKMEIF